MLTFLLASSKPSLCNLLWAGKKNHHAVMLVHLIDFLVVNFWIAGNSVDKIPKNYLFLSHTSILVTTGMRGQLLEGKSSTGP